MDLRRLLTAAVLALVATTAQAGGARIPSGYHGSWCYHTDTDVPGYTLGKCRDLRVHATGYSYSGVEDGKRVSGSCRIHAGALKDPKLEMRRINELALLISFVCAAPDEGFASFCFLEPKNKWQKRVITERVDLCDPEEFGGKS